MFTLYFSSLSISLCVFAESPATEPSLALWSTLFLPLNLTQTTCADPPTVGASCPCVPLRSHLPPSSKVRLSELLLFPKQQPADMILFQLCFVCVYKQPPAFQLSADDWQEAEEELNRCFMLFCFMLHLRQQPEYKDKDSEDDPDVRAIGEKISSHK